jgi:hypothetical protein
MFNNSFKIIHEFRKDRKISEAYLSTYANQSAYKNGLATPEYVKYMTKSLINRGILCENSELIDKIYKSSFEDLFNADFKTLFLHSTTRDISDVYKDVVSVKNLNSIGIYDLFSSLFGAIPAKYFPNFQLGDIDLEKIKLTEENVSQEDIKNIIISRPDYEPPEPTYRNLTQEEYEVGPQEGIVYYENLDDDNDTFLVISSFGTATDVKLSFKETEVYIDDEFGGKVLLGETEYEAGPQGGITYYSKITVNDETEYIPITEFDQEIVSTKQVFLQNIDEVFVKETNELQYTLDDLTEEERDSLRGKLIGPYIDKFFEYYVKQSLIQIKEMFGKYSIWELTSSVNFEADRYQTSVYQILYSNILNFLAYMVYCVNVSDIIDIESCEILRILNKHIEEVLSNNKTVADMIPVETYVNDVIMKNIPEEYHKYAFHRLKLMDPVCDNSDFDKTVTIQQATMTFSENLIEYRQMLDITDLSEVSNETAFWLTMIGIVLFIQTVYMSAYYSQYKTPITLSVETLMKRFTPRYDQIISPEALDKFIDLSKI